ncbi:MAG: alpha-glucosidase/alpha-galactosidase [Chloroflexi bacterium]|nr:alpha-glucosidase/alpha-galactosidase [Chloroflexota bacterium]
MPKIAIIGAGSVVFTRRLLQDVVATPSLADSDVFLMDIDSERLDIITPFAERLGRDTGVGMNVTATEDRGEALDGADYVLTTIRVGDDLEIDQGVPLRYGVDQSVADTIGPGGVFKALRTIPVLLDIAHDIEKLCPDAWLLQYTNPMAMACWAIDEAADIKVVGLCHSVQRTTQDLAAYIGAPREEVTAWVAGINHMSWFLRFERNGEDAYGALWDALDDSETHAQDPVRFEVMRQFGYFVTESTRHMSEYVPYFRQYPEVMDKLNLNAIEVDLARLEKRNDAYFETMRSEVAGDEPLSAVQSDEYACRIMAAMETGETTVINGNVPNDGLISNLPREACVEVPCLVDRLGVHPMAVGALPAQLAALNRTNINVQELAVQAVIERDREAALHAVMLDPLTSASLPLDRIREMFDEMWTAHGDALAEYE